MTLKKSNHHLSGDFDKESAEIHYRNFLKALGFDVDSNPHMRDTPKRVVKMFSKELFSGLFDDPPKITVFDPAIDADDDDRDGPEDWDPVYDPNTHVMVHSGPITVRSMCSHHMMPIHGAAHVAVLLDRTKALPGLSKYARVVEHFSRRPQVQEEMGDQIVDYLQERLDGSALGVALTIRASHMCMTHRGVNEHGGSMMTTTHLRGLFISSPKLMAEYTATANLSFK